MELRHKLIDYYYEEITKNLDNQQSFNVVLSYLKYNVNMRNVELQNLIGRFDLISAKRSREENIMELESLYSIRKVSMMRKREDYEAEERSIFVRVLSFLLYVVRIA